MTAVARRFYFPDREQRIDIFKLRCESRAMLVEAAMMGWHEAVDGAFAAAIEAGLVREIGVDRVQAIMAAAFAKVP